MNYDVLIVGAGPAGRALAASCTRNGLCVAIVDPGPDRPWRPTYGLWADDIPAGYPTSIIATTVTRVRVMTPAEHVMARPFVVLDNAALHRHLRLDTIIEIPGRAVAVTHDRMSSTVLLSDGRQLTARAVVDATGARRTFTAPRPRLRHAAQTAFGLIVSTKVASGLLAPGEAIFMDWRSVPGMPRGRATFLYAMPIGDDRVVLEETCLAGRPAPGIPELRNRLTARLAAYGVRPTAAGTVEERVHVTLDLPLPKPSRTISFGAAASMVHPATGFSVGTSLRLAPLLAGSLARHLSDGPRVAARAAYRTLWHPRALIAHLLHGYGLKLLLSLQEEIESQIFFNAFFALPEQHQNNFLCARGGLRAEFQAGAALFCEAPPSIRATMIFPY